MKLQIFFWITFCFLYTKCEETHYVFTQLFVPNHCLLAKNKNYTCESNDTWYIHELMHQLDDNTAFQCPRFRDYLALEDISSTLLSNLEKRWSYSNPDKTVSLLELPVKLFRKFGNCSTKVNELSTVSKFLSKSIELFDKYHVSDLLRREKITPGNAYTYDEISNAVSKGIQGKKPLLRCLETLKNKMELMMITIFFNNSFDPIDPIHDHYDEKCSLTMPIVYPAFSFRTLAGAKNSNPPLVKLANTLLSNQLKMGSKILIIPLMILIVCWSVIGEIEPNALAKPRETRGLEDLIPLSILNPLKKARAFIQVINDMTAVVTGFDGINTILTRDNSEQEHRDFTKQKLEEIAEMCKKIDKLSQQIADVKETVSRSTALIIAEVHVAVNEGFVTVNHQVLNSVEREYEEFFAQQRQFVDLSKEQIQIFLKTIIDTHSQRDLKKRLEYIRAATLLSKNNIKKVGTKNLFAAVIDSLKKELRDHQICDGAPAYDKLFMYYEYVVKTVTKGYTLLILANQYLKLVEDTNLGKKNLRDGQIMILKNFRLEAIADITEAAQFYLKKLEEPQFKGTYACDSGKWKEGKNYIRVKNYVVDSNFKRLVDPIYTGEQLKYDCNSSFFLFNIDARNGPNRHPYGIVGMPCTTIFEPWYEVRAAMKKSYYEYKLLDYLYYERIMGKSCLNDADIAYPSFYHSTCGEDGNSDPFFSVRKLSTRPQSCDKEKNEVMTNIRFVEFQGIIRPEVQCGIYGNKTVDSNTLRWNTDDRNFTYRNFPQNGFIFLGRQAVGFNLDDISMPEGQFVTAIQFEVENNLVSLKVQGRKMYSAPNVKRMGSTKWHKPKKSTQRTEIKIHKMPLALNQTQQTHEESQSGKNYIKLTTSSRRSRFRGANPVVPFFDMNTYKPSILAPLGGVGIFYKSNPDQAGLLAFKIISPRYRYYINGDTENVQAK